MKVGNFNINDYLERLNEVAEKAEKDQELSDKITNQEQKQDSTQGGVTGDAGTGLIIPDENKKAYDWLKREYDKAKVEVKVEIKQGGTKFEPSMTSLSSTDSDVKDFKPGLFGNTEGTTKAPEGMTKGTEKEPQNPQAKESEEESPAEVKTKSNISVKAKTIEDGEDKKIKEDSIEKKDKSKSQVKAKKRLRFKAKKQ